MEKWLGPCLLLSAFGFLKEFRPSEPFVTEFLVGTWKNFTVQQVLKHYVLDFLIVLIFNAIFMYISFIIVGYAGHLPCLDLFLFGSSVHCLHCNRSFTLQASCGV